MEVSFPKIGTIGLGILAFIKGADVIVERENRNYVTKLTSSEVSIVESK